MLSPPVILSSEELATNAVFRALMWSNTCNFFLSVSEVARFIDADPAEVRRILKEGDGRRRTAQYTLFLRCFGLIPRKYGNRTAWCALGIGAIQLSLEGTSYLDHIMIAEPKGSYL